MSLQTLADVSPDTFERRQVTPPTANTTHGPVTVAAMSMVTRPGRS